MSLSKEMSRLFLVQGTNVPSLAFPRSAIGAVRLRDERDLVDATDTMMRVVGLNSLNSRL